jgi:regulator of protease activity HflC (stomatin/prohibitin superfamily)
MLTDSSKIKFRSGKSTANRARKTVSLKRSTLDNGTQKVNDALGNPVIIGAVVLWHVEDPTKAVFNVENYTEFLSIQTDSTIRNTARLYPYDVFDDDEDENDGKAEQTLRGSSQEIAAKMKVELAEKVAFAGLVIEEVRITHLSYAEEIAAAMLQRQQASAIIAARTKIVDGAVSMVKMAIDKLGEDDIVMLDEERKAQMVSNLLVVLCGNKDAQPVVNSGSVY